MGWYNLGMSHFRITYDGAALETHTMDVRELAPALLAMGDLLDAATYTLHGDRVKSQTNVKASFRTGSFGIDFTLATDWLLKVRDIFAGENASAAANALEILGALGMVAWQGRIGLLAAIKWLRGRKIERVEAGESAVKLWVDGEFIEIEQPVLDLLRDMSVREAVDKLMSPLDKTGIDTFASGTDDSFQIIVSKPERSYFYTPEVGDELLLDETRKMVFSIVSLAFKEDNKWRLHDGAATINATISDPAFLGRVDQDIETFSKRDSLICMVHVQQWQTGSGVRTEYNIIEVLDHRRAGRQLALPIA